MSILQPRFARLIDQRLLRRNTRILAAYFAFVAIVVTIEAFVFKALKLWFEGESYSFLTGVYWVLSTMSTLGLGDIVFTTGAGRLFTVWVLLTGIVLLLVVLPFAFITFFYAPWLASRSVPSSLSGHVVIAGRGDLARPLTEKLELHRIPHFVVEPASDVVAGLERDGIPVVARSLDDPVALSTLRIDKAALVVLDGTDAENTTNALHVRDCSPNVEIAAVATGEHAPEVLRMAGVGRVLSLRQQLGRHLAARLNAGHAQMHTVGRFRDLLICELPVQMTPWVGRSLMEVDLRAKFGVSVLGMLDQSRFETVTSRTILRSTCVPIVIGTAEQVRAIDEFLIIYNVNYNPVLVVGGGVVGRAATQVLHARGVPVRVIDLNPADAGWGDFAPERWVVGDAANRNVLYEAGIEDTPGVLLTTRDDTTNIYLALQCRQIAPAARIVSRVTHENNIKAVQRAGANVVLSHTSLGISSVFAALRRRELVVLGEGIELHEFKVPSSLIGKTLSDAAIAARTGLNVIAIERDGGLVGNPGPAVSLRDGDGLVMVGAQDQLESFIAEYR